MHGTVLANDEFVLSTDAPGAVEDGVEAALGTPAQVLYLQSWVGDMAPEVPEAHLNAQRQTTFASLTLIFERSAPRQPRSSSRPSLTSAQVAEAEIDVVTVAVPSAASSSTQRATLTTTPSAESTA